MFFGTYTPKLDEKGRLILPAKFRNRLSEGLVVTQGQEKCLDVFPSDVFMEEANRARSKGMTSRSGRDPVVRGHPARRWRTASGRSHGRSSRSCRATRPARPRP